MKGSQVFGIIIAIAMIIFSIAFPIPEKHLRTSSYAYNNSWKDESGEEYVGGDAYNYQMEASLKAGYMSGVLALKAIFLVGGILLFFLTLYSRIKCVAIEKQNRLISDCIKAIRKIKKETVVNPVANDEEHEIDYDIQYDELD